MITYYFLCTGMLKLRKLLLASVFEFDSVWQKSQPIEDLENITKDDIFLLTCELMEFSPQEHLGYIEWQSTELSGPHGNSP